MHRISLSFLAGLCVAGAGVAQSWLIHEGPTYLPVRNSATEWMAEGDVDGDGLVDLVVGDDQRTGRVLLGDGTGHFTEASRFVARCESTSPQYASARLGDVDLDGDLDLLVFAKDRFTADLDLFHNDGVGGFTSGPSIGSSSGADRLPFELCDLDADGDLDVVRGGSPTCSAASSRSMSMRTGTWSSPARPTRTCT